MHLDPFEPSNKLVLVGCLEDNGQEHLFNMDVTYQTITDVSPRVARSSYYHHRSQHSL